MIRANVAVKGADASDNDRSLSIRGCRCCITCSIIEIDGASSLETRSSSWEGRLGDRDRFFSCEIGKVVLPVFLVIVVFRVAGTVVGFGGMGGGDEQSAWVGF
jgi:hypothetical protein